MSIDIEAIKELWNGPRTELPYTYAMLYKAAREDIAALLAALAAAERERDALRARVERLEGALRYYTTATIVESWGMQKLADDGDVARKALEGGQA